MTTFVLNVSNLDDEGGSPDNIYLKLANDWTYNIAEDGENLDSPQRLCVADIDDDYDSDVVISDVSAGSPYFKRIVWYENDGTPENAYNCRGWTWLGWPFLWSLCI
jgi:hypothetical protein